MQPGVLTRFFEFVEDVDSFFLIICGPMKAAGCMKVSSMRLTNRACYGFNLLVILRVSASSVETVP